MKSFRTVSSEDYYVQKVSCKCNQCNAIFKDTIPLNSELVCFEDIKKNKYFLPTYGKFGYLELLKALVPEWNNKKNIDYTISQKFQNRINDLVPQNITNYYTETCPFCMSENIIVLEREIKHNCELKWIEIDADFLESNL